MLNIRVSVYKLPCSPVLLEQLLADIDQYVDERVQKKRSIIDMAQGIRVVKPGQDKVMTPPRDPNYGRP